jgi:hypothetical protein
VAACGGSSGGYWFSNSVTAAGVDVGFWHDLATTAIVLYGVTLRSEGDAVHDLGTTSYRWRNVITTNVGIYDNSTNLLAGLDSAGNLRTTKTVAATTPGSVVKKLEIFDASGTSLGFMPVYDAIT